MDTLLLHDLSAFAQANPDRPLLLVLPATRRGALSVPGLDEGLDEDLDTFQVDERTVLPAHLDPPASRVPTLLYGEAERADAGDLRVTIRLQQDLFLREICFAGTTPGEVVRVRSLWVGDAPVFSHSEGAPVERFEHPMLAGLIHGWYGKAGLDLSVHAQVSGPARLVVCVQGDKRLWT